VAGASTKSRHRRTSAAGLRWRDILSMAQATDWVSRAVRQAQLDALVRLVPATVAVQVLTAAVLVVGLRDSVDSFQLGIWFGFALVLCFMRGVRAYRLRHDPEYADQHPATLETICLIITLLAGLWLIPPLFWFDAAPPMEKIFICVMITALLSAGSITLVSLPQAAMIYVCVLTIGCATLALKFESHVMFALSFVYSAVLMVNVLSSARQFIAHTRDRIELREQGEIIRLLREFEASGSGGLWELDGELRFVKMSQELLRGIKATEEQIIGRHCKTILDPGGRIAGLSTGTWKGG
jgi:hypothetical protein